MGRLIGISNRTAAGAAKAGGLAVALWEALTSTNGVWFGWSGKVTEEAARGISTHEEEGVEFALMDLSEAEHEGFYLGYANRALWPVLHFRVDLAYFDDTEFDSYLEVNRRFASLVASRVKEDDVLWVHDYHFFLLGQELRSEGIDSRIGFYLHVPFPPPSIFMSIPDHSRIMRAVCAYDVIGVQTEADRRNLLQYLVDELGAEDHGDGTVTAYGRRITLKAYPIGIDADVFEELAVGELAQNASARINQFLGNRELILGVDRMDYSKGIPNRFEAVGMLLDHYPELRGRLSYTQIAPPSRSKVEEYQHLREQLDELAGRINGDYGDLDWIPIRYLARSYPREDLAGLYRIARVCLVTPLHDGMNLVAKEFVAAQDPENPGVLILSQFAGAADQLGEGALIVNPHDKSGMSDEIKRALEMSLGERQRRWQAMIDVVRRENIQWWRKAYLEDLGLPGSSLARAVSA